MSADRTLVIGMSVLIGLAPATALAQDAEDLDFLEYLGSWDASDEDWLLIREFLPGMPSADANAETQPTEVEDSGDEDRNTEQESEA